MNVLPLGGCGCKKIAQRGTILGCWFLPVFLNWVPSFTESFLVSVPILRDDGRNPFGMRQRQSKSNRCAVIKDIDRVTIEANSVCEAVDNLGQVLESVNKGFVVGGVGKTEAQKIWRYYAVAIRERRNEIPEHVRRRWEAMK